MNSALEDLEPYHTAGGTQAGSADAMTQNSSCYPESSICRDGCLLDDICKYLCYTNKTHNINSSRRALAGFHDTTLKVCSPSLNYNQKKDEDKAFNYGNTMFSGACISELDKHSLIII